MSKCNICPRQCDVDRNKVKGFCQSTNIIKLARVGLHMWEEPCICYGKGSGTIFFSGCNMKCVFCQNYEISHNLKGREITDTQLEKEIYNLQDFGAVNINLVTPTHYSHEIAKVLEKVKPNLKVPVIYNSSGYESVETLKKFSGLIDIYLPDIKYYSRDVSKKYSSCPDYFEVAKSALSEMVRQTGKLCFDENSHLLSGVIVRHLVLPSLYNDSINIFENLYETFGNKNFLVSLMSQYFPSYRSGEFPEINRKVTSLEYKKVCDKIISLGFTNGYIQEKSSATDVYVPKFDY